MKRLSPGTYREEAIGATVRKEDRRFGMASKGEVGDWTLELDNCDSTLAYFRTYSDAKDFVESIKRLSS